MDEFFRFSDRGREHASHLTYTDVSCVDDFRAIRYVESFEVNIRKMLGMGRISARIEYFSDIDFLLLSFS